MDMSFLISSLSILAHNVLALYVVAIFVTSGHLIFEITA
jgi:hypothetical protein